MMLQKMRRLKDPSIAWENRSKPFHIFNLSCREYKIENLFRGQEEGERDTYPGRYLVTNIVCTVMKQQHDDRYSTVVRYQQAVHRLGGSFGFWISIKNTQGDVFFYFGHANAIIRCSSNLCNFIKYEYL